MARTFLIVLLSCLASSALAKGYNSINLDYNYQRPGGDYTNFITTNAQECAQKCKISRRCQAFDFHKSDNSCWLKSRAYPARRNVGVISGVKSSNYSGGTTAVSANIDLNYDTQRPGGDYTRFQAQNARQCAQKCAQDSRCAAFDYTTSDYFCYLKTWSPPARKYIGIISGVKRRYYPQVKSVQELLAQQNYNPGPVDGLMGRKTRIALENYQRDHHLFVTGRIDDATLIALGLLQPSRPAGEVEVEEERWRAESEQQVSAEVVTQVPSTEGQQQEISNEVVKKDFRMYVKTVGVTYLQLADNIYADVLAKIPAGTILQVLSENREWYKVSYQNQVGYVLSEAVDKQ